ncbi:MAG: LuxR C-terminal-related transcriptional regulator [Pseudomonadota bacterium]
MDKLGSGTDDVQAGLVGGVLGAAFDGAILPHGGSDQPPVFSFPIVDTPASRTLLASFGQARKVTAVVAPIGYGKTVLLSVLYGDRASASERCWWFSFDDRDATVEHLLDFLELRLKAFDRARSAFHAMQVMHEGGNLAPDRIDQVLRCLRLDEPVTLFIDNVDYCSDPTLGELLNGLIFRAPTWLKLVMSSNDTLPVDLLRCKLEGLVSEFGTAELSLDVGGVCQMFGAALCAQLPAFAIDRLVRRTEGWPAAVRLMQILLSSSSQAEATLAGFSGADQDIGSLLNSQLLKGFDAPLRAFLLKLSLLRNFDAELAEEATGDADSASHLRYLWEHNVFLIPLEGRQRYRLHNLFREYLASQAAQHISAHERRAIVLRAAQFCDRQSRCADAIEYALSVGDAPMAAAILERTAAVFVRDLGYLRRYRRWLDQLHMLGEHGGWETDYWYVWALVFSRRYELAREELTRLMRRLHGAGDSADLVRLARRLEVIRIAIDVYTDHLDTVKQQARRWLDGIDRSATARMDAPFDVATVAAAGVIHDANECRLINARGMTRIAQASIAQSNSAYGQGWVMLIDALIPLREGDHAAAALCLKDALQRASRELGGKAGICTTIALLAAKCAVEMDLRADAERMLEQGLHKIQAHGIPDVAAYGLEAAVKLWNGADNDNLAPPALRKIAAVYPQRVSMMLSCFITRRLIQLGRPEEAQREAAALGIRLGGEAVSMEDLPATNDASLRDLINATITDLLIATGKFRQAGLFIGEEIARARTDGRSGRLVELALDQALLTHGGNDPVLAARHLTRAIALGARRRYLRPFRDRADLIAALVNDTRPRDWPFVTEEERAFFSEICSGLKVGGSPVLEQMQAYESQGLTGDAPTARELELLRLIEAGLSNQEIADRLSLSVATVKWHLYNLYSKLGVKNRAAALARARTLKLLAG